MTDPETHSNRRPAVAIDTHGCKLNQADSTVMARRFIESGYRIAGPGEPVDVYVLNSCTVTHVADRKARHALRLARRRSPAATVVATGCYAERSPAVLEALDEVDLVVGNRAKESIVDAISAWRGQVPVPCAVGEEPEAFSPRTMRSRAAVKIQEGCDQVCAYCIVPKVRGRERSIPPDDIVAGINRLSAQGFKEVVLTGTQLGSYGFDLPDVDLAGLLRRVLSETAVPRVRVSSLQPQELVTDLLDVWKDRRLCPHFHMPLQSGSDGVLRRMRRRYSASGYDEAVQRIRDALPAASVTADVVVASPGRPRPSSRRPGPCVMGWGFADLHVFPYSVRPGTSAAHFGDQVAPEVKSRRVRAMLEVAAKQSYDYRRRQEGQVRPVLWEGKGRGDEGVFWTGLTDNYVRVLGRSAQSLANMITPARLGQQREGLVLAEALPVSTVGRRCSAG